jgi:hypothetical protein
MTPSPATPPAFTAPKTTTDTSILDLPSLYFYAWLLSVAEFIQATYGVAILPSFEKIAGQETGSPFNVYAFYLYAPSLASNYQNGWMYIGQGMQSLFQGRLDDLAIMILNALSFPNPAPKKVTLAVPIVTPLPPANPLGHGFTPYGTAPGTLHYTDAGPSLPIGTVYENTDTSVAPIGKYVKSGVSFGPFGTNVWWAPFQSTPAAQ